MCAVESCRSWALHILLRVVSHDLFSKLERIILQQMFDGKSIWNVMPVTDEFGNISFGFL